MNLPHSESTDDAERYAVASLVHRATIASTRGQVFAILDESDFSDPELAKVFAAVRKVHDSGAQVRVEAIDAALTADGYPNRGALLDDLNYTRPPADPLAHACEVKARAHGRRMTAAAHDLIGAVRNGEDPTPYLDALAVHRDVQVHAMTGDAAALLASSVGFIDLNTVTDDDIRPTILHVEGGEPLFYAGHVNVVYGEGGTGKTWLGLHTLLEQARAGRSTVFVDYEGTARSARVRLTMMGATPDDLARIHYVEGRAFTPADVRALALAVQYLAIAVVLVDSMAAALAAHGHEESSNGDVATWHNAFAVPISRAGAAVLVLDHVGKADTGKARGATSKRDRVDAAYRLSGANFSRTKPGTVTLRVDKDRHGWRTLDDTAAEVIFTPTGDRLDVTVRTDQSRNPDTGDFRPTELMARVSAWREREPLGSEFILADLDRTPRPVRGNAKNIRAAVQYLRADGYLASRTERVNGRETTFYSLAKPYSRPATVPADSEQPSPAVPARPAGRPVTVPTSGPPPVHPSSPLRGTEKDGTSLVDDKF